MVKKSFLSVILLAALFLASGCVTVNTDGCCPQKQPEQCTQKEVKKSPPKEVRKDVKPAPGLIEKTDNWVKDNLW